MLGVGFSPLKRHIRIMAIGLIFVQQGDMWSVNQPFTAKFNAPPMRKW
jgi:hypothetical protein